jgi:hypothetical protein
MGEERWLVPSHRSLSDPIYSGFDLVNILFYHASYIYYWLNDIAPIVIKYKIKQLGRDGIDNLSILSWETKQEIKRWLKEYFDL